MRATADARTRYEQALGEAEDARRELVELRETTLWAELYPDCHESDVGVERHPQRGSEARALPTRDRSRELDAAVLVGLAAERCG